MFTLLLGIRFREMSAEAKERINEFAEQPHGVLHGLLSLFSAKENQTRRLKNRGVSERRQAFRRVLEQRDDILVELADPLAYGWVLKVRPVEISATGMRIRYSANDSNFPLPTRIPWIVIRIAGQAAIPCSGEVRWASPEEDIGA